MVFGRNWDQELSHLQSIGILIECKNEDEMDKLNVWQPKLAKANLITRD